MNAKPSKARLTTVAMVQIALCAALLCVSAQLAVPLPLGVPFTLQVLMVLLAALLLKPLHALLAQALYTLLGVCGLPVFSGGRGGVGTLFSPTGGFILGFLLAAFLVSLLKGRADSRRAVWRFPFVAAAVGLPCVYLPGILVYMLVTGADFLTAAATLTSVFLLLDCAKALLAALIAVPVSRALMKARKY